MDHDGDFSAYASARWGSLVRSGVFLGCSPEEAQDLAQTTLMRCYAQCVGGHEKLPGDGHEAARWRT